MSHRQGPEIEQRLIVQRQLATLRAGAAVSGQCIGGRATLSERMADPRRSREGRLAMYLPNYCYNSLIFMITCN